MNQAWPKPSDAVCSPARDMMPAFDQIGDRDEGPDILRPAGRG
jgi:hypothetical protein